jgi:hypothetical protein
MSKACDWLNIYTFQKKKKKKKKKNQQYVMFSHSLVPIKTIAGPKPKLVPCISMWVLDKSGMKEGTTAVTSGAASSGVNKIDSSKNKDSIPS